VNREQRRKAEKEKPSKIKLECVANHDMGSMQLFPYKNNENNEPAGYVIGAEPYIRDEKTKEIIGIDRGEFLIWDTFVEPIYRGKGVGKHMLNSLKHVYERMISGARTEAGQALAIKCGFKQSDSGYYVWKKEKEDKKT
jgi:GNAT superfamily N-acetyltransferase